MGSAGSAARRRSRRSNSTIPPEPAVGAPEPVIAAIGAIGVAAALGDDSATWEFPPAGAAVNFDRAFDRGQQAGRRPTDAESLRGALVSIEAAGRAGTGGVQRALSDAMLQSMPPAFRAVAGLAFGRLGRRHIQVEDGPRAQLVAATATGERDERYAAVYALAREQLFDVIGPSVVDDALAARLVDADPEVRAVAIAGLAKHPELPTPTVETFRAPLTRALADPDWRVAVEAVRTLAGEHGDDIGRDLVAGTLSAHWTALAKGDALEAHVVIEAERALAGSAARPGVAAALTALQRAAADASTVAPISRGWIECLAAVALVRAAAHPNVAELASCGHGRLPDHLRLPLLAELVTAGAGDVSTRREAMRLLLGNADARVRGAGLGALASTWKDGGAADHQALVATLVAALGSHDPIIAGDAIEAAPAVLDAIAHDGDAGAPALDRARRRDHRRGDVAKIPRSASSFLGADRQARDHRGRRRVHRRARHGHPVLAVAARDVLARARRAGRRRARPRASRRRSTSPT